MLSASLEFDENTGIQIEVKGGLISYEEAARKAKQHNLACVGNADAICPNCGTGLAKKPQRKAKCPVCGKYIYVRTRPQDGQKVLLTEQQTDVLAEQWAIINGVQDVFLAQKQDDERVRTLLAEANGCEPTANEVQWQQLLEACAQHLDNNDWGLYRNARFEMAEILRKEDKLEDALSLYCWVCYLDCNGPRNCGGDINVSVRRNTLARGA